MRSCASRFLPQPSTRVSQDLCSPNAQARYVKVEQPERRAFFFSYERALSQSDVTGMKQFNNRSRNSRLIGPLAQHIRYLAPKRSYEIISATSQGSDVGKRGFRRCPICSPILIKVMSSLLGQGDQAETINDADGSAEYDYLRIRVRVSVLVDVVASHPFPPLLYCIGKRRTNTNIDALALKLF